MNSVGSERKPSHSQRQFLIQGIEEVIGGIAFRECALNVQRDDPCSIFSETSPLVTWKSYAVEAS